MSDNHFNFVVNTTTLSYLGGITSVLFELIKMILLIIGQHINNKLIIFELKLLLDLYSSLRISRSFFRYYFSTFMRSRFIFRR